MTYSQVPIKRVGPNKRVGWISKYIKFIKEYLGPNKRVEQNLLPCNWGGRIKCVVNTHQQKGFPNNCKAKIQRMISFPHYKIFLFQMTIKNKVH